MTPKQRMLDAYRGVPNDRPPVAPEFWYYYPAKVLGLDMIEFGKRPFHLALKTTFEKFGCEGWGIAGITVPNPAVTTTRAESRPTPDQVLTRVAHQTPHGTLTSARIRDRHEPAWTTERPIKDFARDLPAYEALTLGGDPANADLPGLVRAWKEVGESYLLEGYLGVPFFDYFGEAREGGLEQAIFDCLEHEDRLRGLQERYDDWICRLARTACTKTKVESFFLGCSWSCNSLIGPAMWRQWAKPTIQAVGRELHRHGRLLHVHIHGKCRDTLAEFAELEADCICPFERPPGGDITDLREVARLLDGQVTMNGNIHTVETLIRGTPADVRREVREVLDAFAGNPRVIVGTGDQVGRETPEENLRTLIEEVAQAAPP